MPKATLEYNLEEQDERMAHMRAVKSLDLILAIWDIEQYLRSNTKYAPDSMNSEVYEAFQKVRDNFYRILDEHNISIDELLQ